MSSEHPPSNMLSRDRSSLTETSSGDGLSIEIAKMGIHVIVSELNQNVGATVVQTMAGVHDRNSPYKWAIREGPQPLPEQEARLRLGYRVWRKLASAAGPDHALAWLMNTDSRLGAELPVLFIQRRADKKVLGAAEAFINDICTS